MFAKKVEALPGVSFSAFIDDTKLWASQKDLPSLIDATTKLRAFDKAVGQFAPKQKSLKSLRTAVVDSVFPKKIT